MNHRKSSLVPSQDMTYLEMQILSVRFIAKPTETRVVNLLNIIEEFQEYEEPVYSYSTYPDRRFSSRYHNILKMSPPFASSEGVSASGDRYQSVDA